MPPQPLPAPLPPCLCGARGACPGRCGAMNRWAEGTWAPSTKLPALSPSPWGLDVLAAPALAAGPSLALVRAVSRCFGGTVPPAVRARGTAPSRKRVQGQPDCGVPDSSSGFNNSKSMDARFRPEQTPAASFPGPPGQVGSGQGQGCRGWGRRPRVPPVRFPVPGDLRQLSRVLQPSPCAHRTPAPLHGGPGSPRAHPAGAAHGALLCLGAFPAAPSCSPSCSSAL